MNRNNHQKMKSRSLATINSSVQFSVMNLLPDPMEFDDAPEISHLKIRRPSEDPDNEEMDQEINVKQSCPFKCKAFFSRIWAKLMNLRKLGASGDELDDLDPVSPRTRHSLEFIRRLAEQTTNKSKSLLSGRPSIRSQPSQISLPKPASGTTLVIKRAYKAAFDGLTNLQNANNIFKQLILVLTYTRYAEDPLTEYQMTLTRGKSIVGSYAWILTYALQQLQEDPDMETIGCPMTELKDVVKAMEQLVCQTVHLWKALTHTIETVERVHLRVEKMFTSLVESFPQNADCTMATTRHIKVYRKGQRRDEELAKLKQYDAYKSAHTWANFSYAPLRVIYKDDRSEPKGDRPKVKDNWLGYDVLPLSSKLILLKTIQQEINLIFHTVLNQLEKIDKLLHSSTSGGKSEITAIRCFEDGVTLMGRSLEQLPQEAWTQQQIHDFLDVDKITLDSLDLITVSTATVRTLIHEARRVFHISYETTRDLDYMECKLMKPYDSVVDKCQKDLEGSDGGSESGKRKKKQSAFDIEEDSMEMRDAASQFERSIYQDILKELPVFCVNRAVGLSLQDAEQVFTESSHDLLSTTVHM